MSQKHKQKLINKYKIPTPNIDNIPRGKAFPIKESELKQLKERSNEKLTFSFELFDRKQEEFNLGGTSYVCNNWFVGLLDVLKDVCSGTRNELVVQKRNFYDAHGYDWEDTTMKFPFSEDFLEQVECLQFRLSISKGRVHGFIVGNKFYIVWLDPHHNLYPDDRYGGLKYYDAPKTCADSLYEEVLKLMAENQKLREENENLLDYMTRP